MSIKDDIAWFKQSFGSDLIGSLAGTPISFDLVAAIAYQETGDVWGRLRSKLSKRDVLRLCVGDTIGQPKRTAFPKNKAALVAVPQGQKMFDLAHQYLIDMANATGDASYLHAAQDPDKLVHAFGIFQYDLQSFKKDPDFFLNEEWSDIAECVKRMMAELSAAIANIGLKGRSSLTDEQSCFVAIIYNEGFGNFDETKGLKQGHSDGKLFYGEYIDQYLKIAHNVPVPPITGTAPVPVALAAVMSTEFSTFAAAPAAAAMPTIVTIANGEFDKFGGVNEGSEPLRSRIADY